MRKKMELLINTLNIDYKVKQYFGSAELDTSLTLVSPVSFYLF